MFLYANMPKIIKPKSCEIFLIVPPSRSYTQRLPISLMVISSYLSSKRKENVILDFKGVSNDEAYKRIKERIIGAKPKFIGITCLVSELELVKDMCNFIRENSKESKIIIGGPHPTICPNHFVDINMDFDYLVIGEGEYTFYELIYALENNKNVDEVKGIAYVSFGKLKFTKLRELIQNLDDLPLPAYDKVDMDYYCRPNAWAIRPVYISSFNIFTSRGCPYHCNFCVAHTIFGRRIRFMSPQRVVEHIEYLVQKYKIDAIYFGDESFTVSKERIYEIFNLLKKRNIKILFGCQTRVNLLDEELLRFMKKNNCIQIDLGIESGSDKMLRVINKGVDVKTVVKIGEICKKIKLRHLANMLINLPKEELKDIDSSLDLVRRMKYNVVFWNVYTPFPGVSFGRSLDIEDLNLMLQYPSKVTFDLLEKKYKFGNYKKPLNDILAYLYSNTFHPKYIKFTLNPNYWMSFFRMISFIFDYRYLLQLLKSRRKIQYFTNLFKQKTTI